MLYITWSIRKIGLDGFGRRGKKFQIDRQNWQSCGNVNKKSWALGGHKWRCAESLLIKRPKHKTFEDFRVFLEGCERSE